jgi:hypothetical protein
MEGFKMNQKHLALGVLATSVCMGLYVFKDKIVGSKNEDEDVDVDNTKINSENQTSQTRTNPKIDEIRKKASKIPRLKDDATLAFQEIYSSKERPLVLWATVRAVFVHKLRREWNETPKDFIARVYSLYNKEGVSSRDALSKAYRIAVASLQDKGLLVPESKDATHLGTKWGQTYTKEIGQKELDKRILEFNAMLELAKNS